MSEFFSEAIIVSMLAATIRIATPLILAALGELIAERAGVINLGVEGMMLIGTFVGFFVTYTTGNPWVGLIAAALSGLVVSMILAFMAVSLKLEQFVTGLALNLLAMGLTLYWYRSFTKAMGSKIPSIEILDKWAIPWLAEIPWLGDVFFNQNPLTYLAFLTAPAVWFFLYRTKYGLELRCLGENPSTIDLKGLSVSSRQYLAVLFGGLMAGLAGGFVSICSSIRFVPNMTGGRGWLAIVIVIAGNWQPKWIVVAALVFAFLDAFQLHVQAIGVKFPYQIMLALPYVAAILAMMYSRTRSEAPAALGIPFRRE